MKTIGKYSFAKPIHLPQHVLVQILYEELLKESKNNNCVLFNHSYDHIVNNKIGENVSLRLIEFF